MVVAHDGDGGCSWWFLCISPLQSVFGFFFLFSISFSAVFGWFESVFIGFKVVGCLSCFSGGDRVMGHGGDRV